METETPIKPNEFCNATPFMNRPIGSRDRRSSSQPRKTEGSPSRNGRENIVSTTGLLKMFTVTPGSVVSENTTYTTLQTRGERNVKGVESYIEFS